MDEQGAAAQPDGVAPKPDPLNPRGRYERLGERRLSQHFSRWCAGGMSRTDKMCSRCGAVVSTSKITLGTILVDSRGRTLYLFGKDTKGKSACSGKCASFWPPLVTSGKPRVAGNARASLIGTTKRADGRLQVTYKHHPLYRFAKDTGKGQTNGEGIDAFGAHWYVVSPAGNKIVKSGGGGY